MLFFWRKNKGIDSFAIEVADELYSQIPPDMFEDLSSRKASKIAKRWEKEIQATIIRFRDFKAGNELGVYGKARLHLTFMERLRSHGYSEDVIKELNDFLLVKTP